MAPCADRCSIGPRARAFEVDRRSAGCGARGDRHRRHRQRVHEGGTAGQPLRGAVPLPQGEDAVAVARSRAEALLLLRLRCGRRRPAPAHGTDGRQLRHHGRASRGPLRSRAASIFRGTAGRSGGGPNSVGARRRVPVLPGEAESRRAAAAVPAPAQGAPGPDRPIRCRLCAGRMAVADRRARPPRADPDLEAAGLVARSQRAPDRLAHAGSLMQASRFPRAGTARARSGPEVQAVPGRCQTKGWA